MAVNDVDLFHRTYDTKNFYPLVMLSLNDVFKESMRRIQSGFENVKIIVRCESLPSIKGNQEDIGRLFDVLLTMIVRDFSPGLRLFLYVDCEQALTNAEANMLQDGFKMYQIKFRTNSIPGETWKDTHVHAIESCRKIVSTHHGSFVVNNSNSNGCLFSITIPGKL